MGACACAVPGAQAEVEDGECFTMEKVPSGASSLPVAAQGDIGGRVWQDQAGSVAEIFHSGATQMRQLLHEALS